MGRDWAEFGREIESMLQQHGRGHGGWNGGHGGRGPGGSGGPGGRRGGEWGGPWGGWGPPNRRSGPPPWLVGLFGLAQQERSRPPRARRGDVRVAILAVLADGPLNGYQLIQEIADRTGGAWRPSPGSVYPTLSQLEDEGLVESDDERGRRTLRLSDRGREFLADHEDEVAAVWAPFAEDAGDAADDEEDGVDFASLKPELGRVMNAVWQIITTGTDDQRKAAVGVLVEARRALYQILADHPGEEIDDLGDRPSDRDDREEEW
jgi:DNA-binding PadR family transcriptional regulator